LAEILSLFKLHEKTWASSIEQIACGRGLPMELYWRDGSWHSSKLWSWGCSHLLGGPCDDRQIELVTCRVWGGERHRKV